MTKRTAQATIRNNTGNTIVGVGVIHKYSDDYKHEHQWGIIQPGELAPETMEVEYNTGAFTTGRDWWYVCWFSPDMSTFYYSDPENFRDFIDCLENIAPDAIAAAAGAMAVVGSGGSAAAAAAATAAVAKSATSVLFNEETTAGFKQHILRSEDEDEVTEIVINDDNTITFKSKSGDSETVVTSEPVEK
ncbi:hypothetical protein ACJ41O_011014 [Fusarium nematophilum]